MVLVLATLRNLCQSVSSDHILLAIYGAASELGISIKEAERQMKDVLAHAAKVWPKGFMS